MHPVGLRKFLSVAIQTRSEENIFPENKVKFKPSDVTGVGVILYCPITTLDTGFDVIGRFRHR